MKRGAVLLAALFCAAGVSGGTALYVSAQTDVTLIETSTVNSELVGAPTVVTRLKSGEQMDALSEGAVLPASLILTVDGTGAVVGEQGETIAPLSEVYAFCAEYGMLPIMEVKGAEAGDAFVSVWQSSIQASDLSVMCADKEVLSDVRKRIPEIRGIYDCTACALTTDAERYEKVKEANLSMANVVLLSETQSSPETVEYFQYRFKTVWSVLDGEHEGDKFAVQNLVASGTYGIVSDKFNAVYSAYKEYPARSIARTGANIAHRGLPFAAAENSLKACVLAYESGATHTEIDVHLTKDLVPVVMHDATLARTTDYPKSETDQGVIADMTFEEVRRYHVIKNYGNGTVDPEPIPSVEEVFAEFEEKDFLIVFEIKTIDPRLFTALKPLVERYRMQSKIVFISFGDDVLKNAQKEFPEIPSATLNTVNESNFASVSAKCNSYNMVMDASGIDRYPKLLDSIMKDRGYMSFSWTFDSAQSCADATAKGIYGITNNVANRFAERTKSVRGKENQSIEKSALSFDEPIAVIARSYAGEEKERNGKILSVRDCGTYAEVIAYYDENAEYKVFSQAFRVDYKQASADEEGTGGCNGSVAVGAVCMAAIFGIALAAVVLRKKRKGE